jgi:hypothetical protein
MTPTEGQERVYQMFRDVYLEKWFVGKAISTPCMDLTQTELGMSSIAIRSIRQVALLQ